MNKLLPVHVYLAESRPQVRRQFRASHLSLWLNLIPKIHRSKDLDVCHHLLRSSAPRASSSSAANESSYFDGGDTVAPPCEGITAARSSTRGSTFTPGSIPSPSSISGFARTTSFPEISKNQRTSAAPPPAIRRDKLGHVTSTEQTATAAAAAAASRGPVATSNRQQTPSASNNISDYRLSLCVVIATGCVLLLMNVLMLSCVYCRKAKALRGQGKGAFLAVGDDRNCEALTGFHRVADLPKTLPRITPLPLPLPLPPPISSAQNHHSVPPSCPQRSVSLPKPKELEHHPDGSMIS